MVTQLMLDHFKVQRLIMSGIAGGVTSLGSLGGFLAGLLDDGAGFARRLGADFGDPGQGLALQLGDRLVEAPAHYLRTLPAALAADNLQKMGYTNVISMDGGWTGWVNSGGEVER